MKSKAIVPFVAVLFVCDVSRADFEANLFAKFRQQNESATERVKKNAEHNLQLAESLRSTTPDEAVRLLRQTLHELEDDMGLTSAERNKLVRAVASSLRECETLAETKRKEELRRLESAIREATPPEKPGRMQVGQAAAAVQVTPVVSGDRRFVRVGINGIFTSARPGVPFGPPAFTTIGLNTTVSAPDGGSIVAGGYSSYASSRNEYGAPFLGHLPYAGRLFRNVGSGSFSNSTQIVISPRVIILGEMQP